MSDGCRMGESEKIPLTPRASDTSLSTLIQTSAVLGQEEVEVRKIQRLQSQGLPRRLIPPSELASDEPVWEAG